MKNPVNIESHSKNYGKAIVILGLLFAPCVSYATDIHTILFNLRQQIINPFTQLILYICYICGIYFIWRGVAVIKAFGNAMNQMTRPGEIAGPLVYMVVGALLIWVPATTDSLSQTVFGNDQANVAESAGADGINFYRAGRASEELVGYLPQGVEAKWADLIDTLVIFIEFIGFIAFIRGLFIISKSGNPGVQPGSITKGIVHLIGGVIAINFIPAVQIVHNSIFT